MTVILRRLFVMLFLLLISTKCFSGLASLGNGLLQGKTLVVRFIFFIIKILRRSFY